MHAYAFMYAACIHMSGYIFARACVTYSNISRRRLDVLARFVISRLHVLFRAVWTGFTLLCALVPTGP